MLYEFVTFHREEIITRCRAKVAARSIPPPTESELNHGVPMFLDQLVNALRSGTIGSAEIGRSAGQHGHELLLQDLAVSQVVHDYGDICQTITELAIQTDAPISTDDFRTLNRCLDEAIRGTMRRADSVCPHPLSLGACQSHHGCPEGLAWWSASASHVIQNAT
jgi:hypothetical protein